MWCCILALRDRFEGSMTVDVVSDIICPWCYIGKRRLERAAVILGSPVEIHWHPFQLNPGMPVEGISRREYRTTKFGSWEYSQQLDARVAENARQAGIEFRHDRMERTPNSFRGHVLVAAAMKNGPDVQNRVVESLFAGYFTNGQDVGDPAVLMSIAKDCGVDVDLDDAALASFVRAEESAARNSGVNGVPLIRYEGAIVSEGAGPEEMMAARLRELRGEKSE
jgi:predicted DsbA family dithiol-disulfide isomerase